LVKAGDADFGGDDIEWLNCLLPTNDKGCIVGGRSFSNISGNKTQNLCNYSSSDFWVVKIDSAGNKQWDKDFGGDKYDEVYSILQTKDSGYLLAGYSGSFISGNKTETTWGLGDFW